MPTQSKEHIQNTVKFAGVCILFLWSIHIIGFITGNSFSHYGIYPREVNGLIGIITAPLIHGDLEHLFSNSFPFFVLTGVIYFFYPKVAIPSFIMIYLITGFIVWLFARPVHHIGASGVVYGLLSFVLFSGIFRRNLKSIALALAVTVLYSGYFYGLLPLNEKISWESHLFGALVGILVAYIFKGQIEEDEIKEPPSWANEVHRENHFLPRDIFSKTKRQRLEERQQEQLRRQQGNWQQDNTDIN